MAEHPAAASSSRARPAPSILNDVLGPVMRGPSSSHTAGSYHIGRLCGSLLGQRPARARITFDRDGSYGQVYRQQGVDRAFACAFLGWPLTDARFFCALESAPSAGLDLEFVVGRLEQPDHPNAVDVELWGEAGARVRARAKSVGGGAVEVTEVEGWTVSLTGQAHVVLAELHAGADAATVRARIEAVLGAAGRLVLERAAQGRTLLAFDIVADIASHLGALEQIAGVERVRDVPPVAYANTGAPLFTSGAGMLQVAAERRLQLGRLALAYERQLLGLSERDLLDEMIRRFEIMRAAVHEGLSGGARGLQLLAPAAPRIMEAEAAGRLAIGGLHTRAAARAMAVMHVNGSMGVVCAAPTGGSAGVLPGVLVTLVEERGLSLENAALALFAASAIGVIVAVRATFAAEVAGCQVEIGAAGAMAAAAVVDAAGGSAAQCADAAAIAFQNTMGSVCDLVQGMVEIPCHTRNAAAAPAAFVCADLVLGGYQNPIPLDETIDAVFAVGQMMPSALRCTAKGGLAATPTAVTLRRKSGEGVGQ
jgi:L-serine dehydratase